MPLSLLLASVEDITLAPLEPVTATEVELAIYPPMTATFELENRPGPGEIVLLQIGHNTVRQAVVQRDDDILTPEQLKQHWPQIQKEMLKELQTWSDLKCFTTRCEECHRRPLGHKIQVGYAHA